MTDIALPSALSVFFLVTAGIYLMLSLNVQRVAIGFLLLANGINLGVVAAPGLEDGSVEPLLPASQISDPLPQAFILTAIVIGLGTGAFLLAIATALEEKS